MILLLFAASFVLFVWGLIVLFTGGYVATLDIAANLIASAALVLGIAVLARLGERALAQISGGAGAGARSPGFFNRVSVRAAPEREAQAAAPAAAPTPAPTPAGKPEGDPAQTVIREGVVEGRHFRLYADGSIDAEGPNGMRRYRSVDDLRADMLASSQEASAAAESTPEPEQREAAPEEAREPTARSPFAPRPADEPHPEPHPQSHAEPRERLGFGSGGRREGSTETGLGGVRPSERLSPSRETPSRSSWSDRFRSTSLFDKDEAGEGGSDEDKNGDKPRR